MQGVPGRGSPAFAVHRDCGWWDLGLIWFVCARKGRNGLCVPALFIHNSLSCVSVFIFVFVCLKNTGRDEVFRQHTAAEVWHCPEAGDDDSALTDAKAASAPATSSSSVAPTHHRTTFPPFPSGPGPKEPPTYRQDWSEWRERTGPATPAPTCIQSPEK